jgi:hypothetical protein
MDENPGVPIPNSPPAGAKVGRDSNKIAANNRPTTLLIFISPFTPQPQKTTHHMLAIGISKQTFLRNDKLILEKNS